MKQSIVKKSVESAVHLGKRYTRLTGAELKKAAYPQSAPAEHTEAQRKRNEITNIIRSAALFINRLKQSL